MKLFLKKEKESCCCQKEASCECAQDQRIKVLGSGCRKCKQLEENVKLALQELGLELGIGHVTDFAQIAAYGVMSTPALVIDEKVVASGKLLSKDEAKQILSKELAHA
ncbi:MAG: thioredoxin family protein [Erysipelotrichaceae bacterium]|nr:thioredoxin family protein [Erysipelotrichaceae bacterium]MDY5251224.1 thioredoxin family protein [Erysipelotrichaceae bacterium]